MPFCYPLATVGFAVLIAATMLHGARAAEQPAASDVWKIRLGAPISSIPDSFADFACGLNGGPPSTAIAGFEDFLACDPEPDGLREVYFRYDDELEYWARANNVELLIRSSGTKVYDLPVIMSVLIDIEGVVRGLRLVSDPRDTSVPRKDARFLHPFLLARFRPTDGDWNCVDLPPGKDESPVDGKFLKQDCTLESNGRHFKLNVRYLRGPGQRQIDPHTGQYTEGQFDSHVYFEMRDIGAIGFP